MNTRDDLSKGRKAMDFMGMVQWFRFEEYEQVESTIAAFRTLDVRMLRTAFSWADWERPGGTEWFDWFVQKFSRAGIEIFPVLFYTPAARAFLLPDQTLAHARTSFPPADALHYANFCEEMIKRYGNDISDYYQLWNEWNNDAYWSPLHDPGYKRFVEMTRAAINVCNRYHKRTILGSIIPPYLPALGIMEKAGILDEIDGVAIQAFPGTWDKMKWQGWPHAINEIRNVIPEKEIWITETGLSTITLEDQSEMMQWRRQEDQVAYFETLFSSTADRVFWYTLFDQALDHPTDNVLNRVNPKPADPRAYHFGIIDRKGRKKFLFDAWKTIAGKEEREWQKKIA